MIAAAPKTRTELPGFASISAWSRERIPISVSSRRKVRQHDRFFSIFRRRAIPKQPSDFSASTEWLEGLGKANSDQYRQGADPRDRDFGIEGRGRCPEELVRRQIKYRNNVVEADHGKLKQLIRPVRGFKTLKTVYATIKGYEVMVLPSCLRAIFHLSMGHEIAERLSPAEGVSFST
ncbi:DDE-type integrase/transposase/recombinase [Agrobacterium vitis]|nr:DDE-type integrase/transposase/recombinase [Agrobacterium vitis]